MCALAVVTFPPHFAMTRAEAGYYMVSETIVVIGNRRQTEANQRDAKMWAMTYFLT
jgi:hypothetical protein